MPISAQLPEALRDLIARMSYDDAPAFPSSSEGEVIRRPSRWENFRDTLTDLVPGGQVVDKWRTGEYRSSPYKSALPDVAQMIPDVRDVPIKAIMGALPAAAGMVRMGGKSYPNAFLHRAIGREGPESAIEELKFWSRLFAKGESSQAPSTVVTPSVLQTFHSRPYGLMFNVNDPSQIKHAGYADLWSWNEPREIAPRKRDLVSAAQERLDEIRMHKFPQWAEDTDSSLSPRDRWKRRKYNEAWWKLEELLGEKGNSGHNWTPGTDSEYLLPLGANLDDLLALQKNAVKYEFATTPQAATSPVLWHSEVIPEIDRSMLAGVRLPLEDVKRTQSLSSYSDEWPYYQLENTLKRFANNQNVPIFRWPANMNLEQQLKGLSGNPLRGKWEYPPGRRDYITSSRLPEIFGITELP